MCCVRLVNLMKLNLYLFQKLKINLKINLQYCLLTLCEINQKLTQNHNHSKIIIVRFTGCWSYTIDLMFLVDGSGSIRAGEFPLVIDFVKQITAFLDLESHKVGVMQYSHWYRNKYVKAW